jgi:hypothetical protein
MNHIRILFTKWSDGDLGNRNCLASFLEQQHISLASCISMEQVHGKKVAIVSHTQRGTTVPKIDGIVIDGTSIQEVITLIVRTADCLPIIFLDKTHHIFGVAHAGWKGLYENLIQEMIYSMISLGANIQDIQICIGPHIQVCCYSVSNERQQLFPEMFRRTEEHKKNITFYLDLGMIAEDQLIQQGIVPDHITRSHICTFCSNNEYFSHRKYTLQPQNQDEKGRQVGILAISRYN